MYKINYISYSFFLYQELLEHSLVSYDISNDSRRHKNVNLYFHESCNSSFRISVTTYTDT